MRQSSVTSYSRHKRLNLLMIGTNHHKTPIEIREDLARRISLLNPSELIKGKLLIETVVLSTCNRIEVYALTQDVDGATDALRRWFRYESTYDKDNFLILVNEEAARHLYQVAAGINSMVLGERQILSQVRAAAKTAVARKIARNTMSTLFNKAVRVGRRARDETSIELGDISITEAVTKVIEDRYSRLRGLNVLLVGTGKMIQLIGKELLDKGVGKMVVAGSNKDRVESISNRLGSQSICHHEIDELLHEVDIVVTATNSNSPIINYEQVKQARAQRVEGHLIIIDLAVPRNIDHRVRKLDSVELYNIDDIKTVIQANRVPTNEEKNKVLALVEEELVEFNRWFNSTQIAPTLKTLRQYAEELRYKETQKAFQLIGNPSEHERNVVETLTKRLINSILHGPYVKLREHAALGNDKIYTDMVLELFDLGKVSEKCVD